MVCDCVLEERSRGRERRNKNKSCHGFMLCLKHKPASLIKVTLFKMFALTFKD